LSEALGRDQSVISRNVRKAVGQGFLKDLTTGKAGRRRWYLETEIYPQERYCRRLRNFRRN
jgi:hypothetical protein